MKWRLERDRDREIIATSCGYHKGISFKMARNDALPPANVIPVPNRLRVVRELDLAWSDLRVRIPFAECEISSLSRRLFRIDRRRERPAVSRSVKTAGARPRPRPRPRTRYAKKGVKRQTRKAGSVVRVRCGANSNVLART